MLLVAALLGGCSLGGDDEPYVAPLSTAAATEVDPSGAAATLQQLVNAIDAGDRDAAVDLAADDLAGGDRLGALVDTAVAAGLGDVAMRYVAEDGATAADGTWAAAVDVQWAYEGFDDTATSTEVLVRFRATDDGVSVAGVGGGDLRTPVWMSGPVQVSRSKDLLVVAAPGIDLATYERRARAAVPTVAGALSGWRPRLVVEVPADGAALEAALGAEPGYYGQIAAVTGAGGEITPGAPIHVFVNPDVFDGLGRIGQEVVLAHEATHVATDAPSSSAPTWLVEGYADYVALRSTPLPLSRTAGQIARKVREEGLPTALPTPEEFDTRGPHLGAVYESSWLICVALAERRDAAALERFYTAVSAGADVEPLLLSTFGWSTDELVDAWRDLLRSL